jgi:hypothetical protein
MPAAKPFGDPGRATIMVIGHDPRLQRSDAEADVALFMDYLLRPTPTRPSEARKYELAQAVVDYVAVLAGREVRLDELYVTNLCNEFLPHAGAGATVLIPDAQARRGVAELTRTVAAGRFRVILPMSQQVFYRLCQLGFLDDRPELVKPFMSGARPDAKEAARGAYRATGKAPFVPVCGQRFHHCGVPVIPVVHVKNWPLKGRFAGYQVPMETAKRETRGALL